MIYVGHIFISSPQVLHDQNEITLMISPPQPSALAIPLDQDFRVPPA